MTILPIRMFGDPVLREPGRPVERFDAALARLAEDMIETMHEAPGVGLAAPQVGRSIRVMVFDVGDGPRTLANPELISLEGEQLGEEGCLSLPGLYAPVQRALRVRCEALDIDGKPVVIEADELLARVLQHEVDHIDGILFIDRLDEEVRAEVFAQLRQQQFGIAPPPPDPARAL